MHQPPEVDAYASMCVAVPEDLVQVIQINEDSVCPGSLYVRVAGQGPEEKHYTLMVRFESKDNRSAALEHWLAQMETDLSTRLMNVEGAQELKEEVLSEMTKRKSTLPRLLDTIRQYHIPKVDASCQTDKSTLVHLNSHLAPLQSEDKFFFVNFGDFTPFLRHFPHKGCSGRVISLEVMMELIYQVFEHKASVDRLDIADGRPVQSLAEFAYQFLFLRRYSAGLLAHDQLHDFIHTLLHFKHSPVSHQFIRLNIFGRLVGLYSPEPEFVRRELTTFYVKVLETVRGVPEVKGGKIQVGEDGSRQISYQRALITVQKAFGSDQSKMVYLENVSKQVHSLAAVKGGHWLDLDQFMEIMVQTWETYFRHVLDSIKSVLSSSRLLFSGFITLEQFSATIKKLQPNTSDRQCLAYFQEAFVVSQSPYRLSDQALPLLIYRYKLTKENAIPANMQPQDPNSLEIELPHALQKRMLLDAVQNVSAAVRSVGELLQSHSKVLATSSVSASQPAASRLPSSGLASSAPLAASSSTSTVLSSSTSSISVQNPFPSVPSAQTFEMLQKGLAVLQKDCSAVSLDRLSLNNAWFKLCAFSTQVAFEKWIRQAEMKDLEKFSFTELSTHIQAATSHFLQRLERYLLRVMGTQSLRTDSLLFYQTILTELRGSIGGVVASFEQRIQSVD
eukprot:GILI01014399.1.p1 GENE.GILI01014399.1~~GILI01014399.1.p1  ORF type:complete len:674 (-),score=135.49 GILI01014399.1:157-2178(-)